MKKNFTMIALVALFLNSCTLLFPPGVLSDFVHGRTLIMEQIDSSSISWLGNNNSFGRNHITYNDKLYFIVRDSGGDDRMIGWDGNSLFQVNTSDSDEYSLGFENPIIFNGYLFFEGENTNSQREIFVYDGIRVDDVSQDMSYSNDFGSPAIYNNTLYFQSDGGEISYYNTGAGNIATLSNPEFSYGFSSSIVYNNELFFRGRLTNSVNQEMLSYNLSSFYRFTNSEYSYNFGDPTTINGVLIFRGVDTSGMEQLFYYTPTDGVNRANNLSTFTSNVQSGDYAVANNKFYFQGINTNYLRRLYEFDTITKNIIELENESGYKQINDGVPLYSLDGKVYFSGSSNTSQYGAHVYDGSSIKDVPVISTVFNGGIINPTDLDHKLIFLGIVGDISTDYHFKHFFLDESGIKDIRLKNGTKYDFSLLGGEGYGVKFRDHVLIPGGYVENNITNYAIYKISFQ